MTEPRHGGTRIVDEVLERNARVIMKRFGWNIVCGLADKKKPPDNERLPIGRSV